MEHIKELMNLGLKDKEASVYLSCLELGPSPAQIIAKKAGVVRATTYVILEELMAMGLVTKYKEGKKTMFSAEAPRQLLRLLEKQEEVIREKQNDLEQILPELQMLTKAAGDKPSVRYFEGKEGLRAIRQEMVMYGHPGDIFYNFTPADHLTSVFPDDEDTHFPQRVAKQVFAKTLFTTHSESLKLHWLSKEHSKLTERRFVSPDKFPVSAGMTIYRDRIAIGSYTGKLFGVVIESEQMANMMRALFELAWENAQKD
ncbi:MAG TPA: helix-turn-helix domain-containing protein [Candidatus Andersenbacteria bacterium]|nr:helix-turn-helix domain-containing protein [Candidatus Andersenbacteria bacterium]